VGSISIPVEGEAGLGEEGRAEGEDGRAGDVGALVEQVREDDGGGPARAEVVARREVELEEAREEIGVGAVVPGVAAGAGSEGERAEARVCGAQLSGKALARDLGNPVADQRRLRGGLAAELGDNGVGVLVAERGRDGTRGGKVEVKLRTLADDLAEVFALVEDGGCGAGDEDGGDGRLISIQK
jgi:hypothetical protein